MRRNALEQNKPHTCRYIQECLGFECPAGGCGVKAPVVFAQYTLEERAEQLLENELTAEDVFEEKTLSIMACAREQMPGVYGKFKLRLRRLGVSLRDFERAVAHKAEAERILVQPGNVLEFILADGNVITRTWKDHSRRESWTPEKREQARQKMMRYHNERRECANE